MNSLLRMLHTAERTVTNVGELFALLERRAEVFGLSDTFKKTGAPPSAALASLGRVGSWFELRHNGLIYPFIDVALLWDTHCWLGFERWRLRYGRALRDWFSAIGQAEALSSLAGFGFDEPDCCFAEIDEQSAGFRAVALGHPLIHPAVRVSNDVTGLQPGHGLLVTGSNMSGKSTYLRAIGLGCAVGLAGGYVCAKQLRLCRTQIATSMRISDNLASGVSHFYAELQKLKGVIDAVQGPLPVLFLLDEVLHGTNSLERQIGARFVIAELLRTGAFGAVSTHDSALCELSGELVERLRLVHFRESVTGGEMTFDYRLYPGPVTAGNALRLMQKLGIPVPLADT
jgi:DNA mismatch repair ATPase MutS